MYIIDKLAVIPYYFKNSNNTECQLLYVRISFLDESYY